MRFIAVNNGIDSEKPDTLEFAPFINIMSEWYAKDISKKVKTGIKTKGMSGKPIATEAPYGYMKDPDNKDFWIIDEEAAEVVRLIFRLFIGGKNRNQIAVYLKNEQILYDAAARYLKELKDSGEEITPKAWQREIDLLTAQKQVDTIDMKAMREELKAVERLRKAADQLARQEQDKSHDRGPER